MRLVQRHSQALDPAGSGSEVVFPDGRDHAIEYDAREKFGRGVVSLERRVVIQIAEVHLGEDGAQHFRRATDVDNDAVGVEPWPAKLDVDDHRGAVQPLRGAEHLAPVAVGNHHIVAHGNAVHRSLLRSNFQSHTYSYRIRWHSVSLASVASSAILAGNCSNPLSPVMSTSSLSSVSIVSASCIRRRASQRARCDEATLPTWDDLSVSRRAWNASPSASGTDWSPYQLISTMVASKPATFRASSRPAGEPLA